MDKWEARTVHRGLQDKYRSFQRGSSKFRRTLIPDHDTLLHAIRTQGVTPDGLPYLGALNAGTNRIEEAHATATVNREMTKTLELLQDGGVGFMPEKKGPGWIRIMFENWNSLGVSTQAWKVDRLNYLVKHLNIDIIAGCECQVDWTMVHRDKQFLNLVTPGKLTKGIAAHNSTERIQRDQMGGTAIAGTGRICDVIM